MLNLKELAGKRYRITLDESYEAGADDNGKLWFYQVACRYGHIFVQGENQLGVYVKGARKAKAIEAIPGLKILQRGDKEASFSFAPELLDIVAAEMGARKRRQLTDEQREALVAAGSSTVFQKTRGTAPEIGPIFHGRDGG